MRSRPAVYVLVAAVTLLCAIAFAQDTQLQGIIVGRSGSSMTLQLQANETMVVQLSPGTQVAEPQGVFRKKHLSVAVLIPGLPVKVNGVYNNQNQFVANSVEFKGDDLKTAQDIQAGLQPTEQQVQANQAQLSAQQKEINANQAEIEANQAKIAANKAAIAAANKRFGELGDYNIMDEVTVLFANGKTGVEPQFVEPLLTLATKAKTVDGYVIQVQGYASKVGSAALNQKLSMERAQAVLAVLEQQGSIPLTNILAPGAMGTSQEVASDATAEGQAENRRVVVRVLQNKGIAGM